MTSDEAYAVSLLLSQALIDVELIVDAPPQRYAPTYRNQLEKSSRDRRSYTLKDARHNARCAAKLLREAWQLLDPVQK